MDSSIRRCADKVSMLWVRIVPEKKFKAWQKIRINGKRNKNYISAQGCEFYN